MSREINRRAFLGVVGAGAGLAAAAFAGCSNPTSTTTSTMTPDKPETAREARAANGTPPVLDVDRLTVSLNSGQVMPILGIGTYRLSPSQAEASVTTALQAGYRLVDTARTTATKRASGAASPHRVSDARTCSSRPSYGQTTSVRPPRPSTPACPDSDLPTST